MKRATQLVKGKEGSPEVSTGLLSDSAERDIVSRVTASLVMFDAVVKKIDAAVTSGAGALSNFLADSAKDISDAAANLVMMAAAEMGVEEEEDDDEGADAGAGSDADEDEFKRMLAEGKHLDDGEQAED